LWSTEACCSCLHSTRVQDRACAVKQGMYCALMTQAVGWPDTLMASVAAEVRRYRKRRGWSAQQLADACAGAGLDFKRSVIANLESGRRPTLSVPELLVLGRVLDVPPALLLFPVGTSAEVPVSDDSSPSPWSALQWFVGEHPFPATTDSGVHTEVRDWDQWDRNALPLVLYRVLQAAHDDLRRLERDDAENDAALEMARKRIEQIEAELRRTRLVVEAQP